MELPLWGRNANGLNDHHGRGAAANGSKVLRPLSTQSGCRVIVAGIVGIDPVRTSDTYVEKGRDVNTGAELVYKLARVSIG